jgi:hypothetical protein
LLNCEGYGIAAAPGPLPPPVASGIRTLVTNGAIDPATPVEWGEAAFAGLTNATMITFPMSVHGASVQSSCARDVTLAFFTYPEEQLNLACIDTLRPDFALPGDALPSPDLAFENPLE